MTKRRGRKGEGGRRREGRGEEADKWEEKEKYDEAEERRSGGKGKGCIRPDKPNWHFRLPVITTNRQGKRSVPSLSFSRITLAGSSGGTDGERGGREGGRPVLHKLKRYSTSHLLPFRHNHNPNASLNSSLDGALRPKLPEIPATNSQACTEKRPRRRGWGEGKRRQTTGQAQEAG